jgi:peptide/nickel transport system permease protein
LLLPDTPEILRRRRGVKMVHGERGTVIRTLSHLLVRVVPVLIAVTLVTFLLFDLLPGDAAVVLLGEDATPSAVADVREELGLDRPALVRYSAWAIHAFAGDLGRSMIDGAPVRRAILSRLPATLEVLLLAELVAIILAILSTMTVVTRYQSWRDLVLAACAYVASSTPPFVSAVGLILLFSVRWHWLPATGFTPISEGLWANLRTVILPVAALAIGQWAVYGRLLRREMLDELRKDYVLCARAKGLPLRRVLIRHVLANSSFSLVTVVGLNVSALLGGAVIVERVFAIPGVGRLLLDAVAERDLVMVQGIVLFIAAGYVVIGLVLDVVYSLLDPRIRHGAVLH